MACQKMVRSSRARVAATKSSAGSGALNFSVVARGVGDALVAAEPVLGETLDSGALADESAGAGPAEDQAFGAQQIDGVPHSLVGHPVAGHQPAAPGKLVTWQYSPLRMVCRSSAAIRRDSEGSDIPVSQGNQSG